MVNKKATDMNIDRLPTSATETPQLLGSYDAEKNSVSWALDGDVFLDSPSAQDGTNWFIVWKVNDVIHCQATCWFHHRGTYSISCTDLTPDQIVALADRAAVIACEYMNNGDMNRLEKTS